MTTPPGRRAKREPRDSPRSKRSAAPSKPATTGTKRAAAGGAKGTTAGGAKRSTAAGAKRSSGRAAERKAAERKAPARTRSAERKAPARTRSAAATSSRQPRERTASAPRAAPERADARRPRTPAARPRSEERAATNARVEAQGYRRFDGERRSGFGPALSLGLHSFQRALGIRRSAPSKILPFLTILIAYLPAAALVGAVALLPVARNVVPNYVGYFGLITAAIFLFTALASPELLCPDRRTGMLGLYLTSPLTPLTYLAAKAGAILAILSFVTLGPPLLLTIAYALQGVGPDGPLALLSTLGRIVAAGVSLAAIFGALALAVSSLTDRRAFASAGIILAIFIPNIVAGVLVEAFDYPEWVSLATFSTLPLELVQRIYGQPGFRPETATWAVALGWVAAVALCTAVLVVRYGALPRRRAGAA